jgi:serine/threonine-protein kinase
LSEDRPAQDPLIGQTVEGRYRVLEQLGRGGMGIVYRVEHTLIKKELALKLLHPGLGASEELAKRFEREAEAAARLQHPNLINVTDFGKTADGRMYMVMELLQGPSLSEVIGVGAARRALGVLRSLHIARQILRALEHAHRAGVVHRDLKPDNIILVDLDGDPDYVKVLDFGIAKLSSGAGSDALTQTGLIYGTPEYLSPEQALGEPTDARADLYAAGVILYEMLTGRRPFESESKLALVSMHITDHAMPAVDVVPEAEIPLAISRAVERAMVKRREDRWPDAASFLEALDPARLGNDGRVTTVRARARRLVLGLVATLAGALTSRRVPLARPIAWVLISLFAGAAALAFGLALRDPDVPTLSPDLSRAEHLLKAGRTCKERRAAALELIASRDRRWLGALEAARDRRGGVFGLERANACMQKELEAGVTRLRESP